MIESRKEQVMEGLPPPPHVGALGCGRAAGQTWSGGGGSPSLLGPLIAAAVVMLLLSS